MDGDNIELDLSDLMAPDATSADAAHTDTPTDAEGQPPEAPTVPSPSTDDEVERLRAENQAYKQHVDNLLSRMGQQPSTAPAPKQDDALPDIAEQVNRSYDKNTAPALLETLGILERRLEAKLKDMLPRKEWDAAQPVLQRAVLNIDEQNARAGLAKRGVTEEQLGAAKKEMARLIANGERFSSYEAAYRAGLTESFLSARNVKGVATKAAREAQATTAANADNSPANTPANKAKITLSKDTLLNRPFDALEQLKNAGVK